MHWTVHVGVALLNVAWIAFFLQPDPFSVSVQRRSSDSSVEFCIRPPSAVQAAGATFPTPGATVSGRRDVTQHEDSVSQAEKMSAAATRQVKLKDLDETPAAGFTVLDLTASEGIPTSSSTAARVGVIDRPKAAVRDQPSQASEGIPTSSSTAARVGVIDRPKAPARDRHWYWQHGDFGVCCMKVTPVRINVRRIKQLIYQPSECPVDAIIVITTRGKVFCISPHAPWIRDHPQYLVRNGLWSLMNERQGVFAS